MSGIGLGGGGVGGGCLELCLIYMKVSIVFHMQSKEVTE